MVGSKYFSCQWQLVGLCLPSFDLSFPDLVSHKVECCVMLQFVASAGHVCVANGASKLKVVAPSQKFSFTWCPLFFLNIWFRFDWVFDWLVFLTVLVVPWFCTKKRPQCLPKPLKKWVWYSWRCGRWGYFGPRRRSTVLLGLAQPFSEDEIRCFHLPFNGCFGPDPLGTRNLSQKFDNVLGGKW